MTEERPTADEVLPPEASADDGAWEDPIVAELHAIRARLWDQAGGTMDGLYASLKASETARGAPLVPAPSATSRGR